MAKRDKTPSLTWERVQKGISAGSLNVDPIPGTSMLLVNWGRVRLTWIEDGKKRHTRIRLTRVYLNPRWIPLPKEYPLKVEELGTMGSGELATRGIIRLNEDGYKLLIYQQLNDLYSLQRQFHHIKPQYLEEEKRLWEILVDLLLKRYLDPEEKIPEDIIERLEQIGAITTHLAGRKEAINTRIRRLKNTQINIKGILEKLMELVPSSKDEKNVEGTVIGLGNSLEWQIKLLRKLLKDDPFYNSARWAIYHVRHARIWLEYGLYENVTYYLEKAISLL
jgi:hypothetical protein